MNRGGGPHVLIIDDDFDIRLMIAQVLELEGMTVASAANGLEALVQLRGGPAPCVILLDLMMPVMNGWQFMAEQARDATTANIPVVLISGDDSVAERAETMGAAGYLKKPVDIVDLIDTVKRYC